MKQSIGTVMLALGFLSGCSDTAEDERSPRSMIAQVEPATGDNADAHNSFGFMEAMEPGFDLTGQRAQTARSAALRNAVDIADRENARPAEGAPAATNQIAYSYGFGFRIDGDKIAELQSAHVAQCEAIGPSCRVLRMSTASMDDWDGYGELKLQVAAELAAGFGDSITKPANDLGGELVSSVRDGEDLAEQIIDTEARLASRLVLRDKLTAILAGNRGSVDELVKAEKAVADVNEEIDATRTKLEQFRNRIRFSEVEIKYEPYFGQSQIGFGRPVVEALRSIGSTLGSATALLIYGLTALVPFVLFGLLLRWALHRSGLRIRFWKNRGGSA
ncbi:MAG: DUF4349 domain-containing protein [Erythrobacter sp.]